jgi:phosphoribosylamine--glycine ligase
LIRSDLFEVLYRTAQGDPPEELELWDGRSAATVVMAAQGYPGSYGKGFGITGADEFAGKNAVVFHAGTARGEDGLVSSGGRVLAVTGWNDNLRGALKVAYDGIESIKFEQAYWRKDIGHRVL